MIDGTESYLGNFKVGLNAYYNNTFRYILEQVFFLQRYLCFI